MSLTSAKAAIRDLATKAQTVAEDASLTPAEKMAKLDDYQTDLKSYQDEVSVHEKARGFMVGGETAPETKSVEAAAAPQGWGEFTGSPEFKAAQISAAGRKRFEITKELGLKAPATIAEGTTIANGFLNGNNGSLGVPTYVPGIVDLRFSPITVSSLFAQGSTSTSIISYVKETAETQGAAAVAEAALKPQADMTTTRLNEQVGKIAVFAKITDEMIQDIDYIQSFLSSRLINQVAREEENEVLNGTGYPAINGVLNRTGLQTPISAGTTGTIAKPVAALGEAVFKMITQIRTTAYFEPDAVVMNPTDWQYLQLAKDGQSQYYSGGPFTGSYGNGGYSNIASLWGFKVVLSTRIASGTALVGAFEQGGQLFRRQGIVVEMANQNQDDFINNLITVRAEERAALAIWRPNVFGLVTVTWA